MFTIIQMVLDIWADGIKRTFDFSGRATRSDFNIFMLIYVFVAGIALFVLVQLDIGSMSKKAEDTAIIIFSCIMFLLYIPAFSLTVRRARDAGASPMVGFLYFVPIIGWWYLKTIILKPSVHNIDDEDYT